MKRKNTVLALAAMLFAICVSAEAQQAKKIPWIGYLTTHSTANEGAFLDGLRSLGYIEGKTHRVHEPRFNLLKTRGKVPKRALHASGGSPKSFIWLFLVSLFPVPNFSWSAQPMPSFPADGWI